MVPTAICLVGLAEAEVVRAASALRVEVVAAPNFVVDSNVESPSSYAPRAAYIGARVWNDSATTMTNVMAYIGDFIDGVTDTPGVYPRRTHGTLTGFAPDSKFALTHEGGSLGTSDATRYLGTIPAGSYKMVYWLVSYPNKDALGHAVWGPSVKPDDDLWLQYDIWTTGHSNATRLTNVVTSTATMRNEISAMANKISPQTANQVPQVYQDLLQVYSPSWTNSSPSVSPGSTILAEGYWYGFGNVSGGFDANNNLVPDQDAWMQPVGDATLFDAGSFRLVHTHALLIVKLKSGGEAVYFYEDQLYFPNLPDNNGVVGWVGYEFIALNGSSTVRLTPYQEAASGSDNEKFNGDFGVSSVPPLVSGAATVSLGKTASAGTIAPAGTLQYTLSFTNTGSTSIGDPSLGAPLVVKDHIPSGTVYVAGSAGAANTLPSGVSAYTIFYSTNGGGTWSPTEPAVATNVTDLQWWLSDPLTAGAHGTTKFQVTVTNMSLLNNPVLVNTGMVAIANGPALVTATAATILQGNNALSGVVFNDIGTGTGGNYANGTKDGSETGIGSVPVSLYYDANANGLLETTDTLVLTTNSDSGGSYAFQNLYDGNYLAVVDTTSSSLPAGVTPTTLTVRSANLDASKATGTAVTSTTNDFGFAPAFVMQKTAVGSTNCYEGYYLTNSIELINLLPGNGTATGTNRVMVWATNGLNGGHSGTAWINYTNAFLPPGPDGRYANPQFSGNTETLSVYGWGQPAQPGRVTNVQVVITTTTNGGDMKAASITVKVYDLASVISTTLIYATNFGNSNYSVNVTAARSWQWADFRGTNFYIDLVGDKGGASPSGLVYVDSVGYLVTSDTNFGGASATTTIDPLPFSDGYNTNLFQYVSADPQPTTVATNAGTLIWTNVGPLYPGGTNRVSVWFKALQPPTNRPTMVSNLVLETAANYANGRPVNAATNQVNLKVFPTGTIGDTVWRDLDGNGLQEATEPGLAGVRVYLTNGAIVRSTVTDASGHYLFEGLTNNADYTVGIDPTTLPVGWVSTKDPDGTKDNRTVVGTLDPLATDGSDTRLTNDFGYRWTLSTIWGTIWNDQNQNRAGSPDSAEPMLTNVTIRLYNQAGSVVGQTNTDLRGFFSFTNISSTGSYTVEVTSATGPLGSGSWTESYASAGSNALNRIAVNIAALGTETNVAFSYYQTGAYSIGNTIFYDWNGNALQDGTDEGIAGVTVYLYSDNNTNGILEASSDPLVATAVTDTSGHYSFANLPSGSYVVVVNEASSGFPRRYYPTKDPNETGHCTVCDGLSAVTITSSSRTDQNFGYQPYGTGTLGDTVWRDLDGNRVQSGPNETGITNVTLTLQADLNGDGTYVTLASTNSDAQGHYWFGNLPDGTYRVQVDTASAFLPTNAFGQKYIATTATLITNTLSGGGSSLAYDFGFAGLGAIGDTIFWDANANGSQDLNETGISNVVLKLYLDTNGNGTVDGGESLLSTTNTDASGRYLFTGLIATNYVVVVDKAASAAIASVALTADPNADGQLCTNQSVCDNVCGVTLAVGGNFMGADFGYQPPGVIGDTLWVDTDNNGVRGATEPGIAYVPVVLYSNTTALLTNTTDANGYYSFNNILNGTYKVVVRTTDPNFPTGLTATRDPDGTLDSVANDIVIASGHVASLGLTNCGSCDLNVDFGYRYVGANSLSGTVGLDGTPANGLLGSGASGVASDEVAFANQTVYLYLWKDNGNGTIDSGETIALNSTTTDTNGDYTFTGLPSGGVNDWYLVSLSAPMDNLTLTTTTGNTPAVAVVKTTNALGNTVSAYQKVTIAASTTNVDFAFASTVGADYGDLPLPYPTTLAENGPRHVLSSSTVWLGANAPDADTNLVRNATATGDDITLNPDDEDGVTAPTLTQWREGANGGSVQVIVHGSGYLVGWIDFLNQGRFDHTNALVINQAVTTGTASYNFTIPTGTFASPVTNVYARFRLFATEPNNPQLAYTGQAVDGEVEDYQFTVGHAGTISGTVYQDGGAPSWGGDTGIPAVLVTLYRDTNGNGVYDSGEPSLAATRTDASGSYSFTNLANGDYVVVETDPAGTSSVADRGGANDNHIGVTLAGADVTGRDFLDNGTGLAAISGLVLMDANYDTLLTPSVDTGIPSVTVRVYLDGNHNQAYDSGDTLVGTATTGVDGAYAVTGLPAALDYVVAQIVPSGVLAVRDSDGIANSMTNVAVVNLASGGSSGNNFLDNTNATVAAISGHVVDDPDRSGTLTAGDSGLNGVTVRLFADPNADGAPDGTAVQTNLTASDGVRTGAYQFTNVAAGSYIVVENDPFGYSSTAPTTNRIALTVVAGQIYPNNDFYDAQCGEGTTAGSGVTNGNMHLVFANSAGLTSVQALTLNNCTMSWTAYDGDTVLGSGNGVTREARTTLPEGTRRVLLIATKVVAGQSATVNAIAMDTCGTGKSFDPVITTLAGAGPAVVRQSFEGIPAAEHYARVMNGQPGLRWLELIVNGHSFALNPLPAGADWVLDLIGAYGEGETNRVDLAGQGEIGSEALIVISDTALGELVPMRELKWGSSQPVLEISREGACVVLSWAGDASGFTVQGRATLGSADGWTVVPQTPELVDGRHLLRLETDHGLNFFRLFKP